MMMKPFACSPMTPKFPRTVSDGRDWSSFINWINVHQELVNLHNTPTPQIVEIQIQQLLSIQLYHEDDLSFD